ncbi:alcohol acetyltransferase-domain-containing protein [Protomyces lactucae-debilis]|uniref:Alcohol acetyltransferase-domain-containing protein n=1 Tax=Protomyces lactucae-debilis TaxID=2754530 RepID=A0A1Y2FDI1_PROLT|nr:alcohol acetyltransferase-domain-containing protein [Protomyces lactucae-debilis]ORY81971.1 alcohol acetyltransferase-domain-containing protein [Protomyces lactucae-debilis]
MSANDIITESRPCGKLELWCVYRADLKCYLNVNVSCLYSTQDGSKQDAKSLEESVRLALLKRVIPENALLGCSIEETNSEKCYFKSQAWSLAELPIEILDGSSNVEQVICATHNTALPVSLPWKVQILPASESSVDNNKFWLSFTFHHAIADGSSGLIFHKKLLAALNEGIDDATVPSARDSLPQPIEVRLDVRPGPVMLLGELWQIVPLPSFVKRWFSPSCYLGQSTTLQQRVRTQCRLRSLVLPADSVAKLRGTSKKAAVSIHALIHAALLHAFSDLIGQTPKASQNIKAYTPINLRPLLKGQQDIIANYVSTHASSLQPRSTLVETAKAFYKEINQPGSRSKALQLLGLFNYIDNHAPRQVKVNEKKDSVTSDGSISRVASRLVAGMQNFVMERLERATETSLSGTFEISNLGNWQPKNTSKEASRLGIDDVIFSGSNGPIGELINLCVVTLAGGPMRIIFSYRTNFISEEMVDSLVQLFETHLAKLCA